MSMVKMVEAELKTEVSEDIRAAIITASIMPRSPASSHNKLLHLNMGMMTFITSIKDKPLTQGPERWGRESAGSPQQPLIS
jgi:hypothetical protein